MFIAQLHLLKDVCAQLDEVSFKLSCASVHTAYARVHRYASWNKYERLVSAEGCVLVWSVVGVMC